MKKFKFLLLLVITGSVLMGCPPKDDDPDPKPKPGAEEQDYVPTFPDSRGSMVAILSTYFVNINDSLIGSTFGTARAKFFAEDGTTMVDAGTVKVKAINTTNSHTLVKKGNHLYEFDGSSGNGIQFNNNPGADWEVSGNENNNIPVIENANISGFTSEPLFKGPVSTINSSSDFTVEMRQTIANVHSTIFAIYGKNGSLVKVKEATAVSHTFTAAEVASVGKGEAVLQVGAFRNQSITVEGETFYLVNEKLASQDVVIE